MPPATATLSLRGPIQLQFLDRLRAWCEEKGDRIQGCFVPFRGHDRCIKVFVVGTNSRFDFSLSDSIADLEAELIRAGWPCDILQVAATAPEELRNFFDPEHSIQVCGDGNRDAASREG
jgi:hypothetical protein